ncbi:LemA family protein [bacterium]|nr:LemA family protein [bacterium]
MGFVGIAGCFGILAVFVIALVVIVITLYNKLVGLKNRAENAWADIDVQLKKRYDLIPNLVETVKGYASHESETLENVIKARQQAIQVTDDVAKMAQAENVLTQALRQLFAVAESYPDLKANQNFLELQASLEKIENDLSDSRRYYNAVVRDLNTTVEKVPTNFVAMLFHFTKREYFEIEDVAQKEAPKVDFGKS